ncbi:MAG: hypothetical protein ACU836_16960 [Gammaproteobacteria bacterium]
MFTTTLLPGGGIRILVATAGQGNRCREYRPCKDSLMLRGKKIVGNFVYLEFAGAVVTYALRGPLPRMAILYDFGWPFERLE